MSSPDATARPSQVTVAGWVVTIASAFLVFVVFDSLSGLQSLDSREAVAESLKSGNFKGLGISVDDVLAFKRWGFYVSAVAAVVTGILGFFALRRDKVARIVLTVAAVPIVLAVPFTESFFAMLIGAGAAVLWSRPARDWFAGRPITPREPRRSETPTAPTAPRPASPAPWLPPSADGSDQPRPLAGWGAPGATVQLADLPPPTVPGPGALTAAAAARQATRPRQVHLACMLTWIFTALTALAYLVALAIIAIDQQAVINLVKDNPGWDSSYGDDLIVKAVVVSSILFLVWCAGAAVVAVFTWRGEHWAWVVHLVSLVLAALVAVVVFPASLVHLSAIAATLGMLTRRGSRDWFLRGPR